MANQEDGLQAFTRSVQNKASRWPSRDDPSNRLFPDCAPVLSPSFRLEAGESIFTIGSCFARNIERHLQKHGYILPCLKFEAPASEGYPGPISNLLNKYSPQGMLNEVLYALKGSEFRHPEAFLIEGLTDQFSDYQLHAKGVVSRSRAFERREEVQNLVRNGISSSRVFIITLGLVETWYDTASSIYLNDSPTFNMVKKWPNRFKFEVLDYESSYSAVEKLIKVLFEARKGDIKIILTVSPVPLQRTFTGNDVIVANCYSKSLLRSVAQTVADKADFVDYFPSYESVVYSRNLTTWVDDQVHVTESRVQQIVERMTEVYLSN